MPWQPASLTNNTIPPTSSSPATEHSVSATDLLSYHKLKTTSQDTDL